MSASPGRFAFGSAYNCVAAILASGILQQKKAIGQKDRVNDLMRNKMVVKCPISKRAERAARDNPELKRQLFLPILVKRVTRPSRVSLCSLLI
jgi:hypothetical protein